MCIATLLVIVKTGDKSSIYLEENGWANCDIGMRWKVAQQEWLLDTGKNLNKPLMYWINWKKQGTKESISNSILGTRTGKTNVWEMKPLVVSRAWR